VFEGGGVVLPGVDDWKYRVSDMLGGMQQTTVHHLLRESLPEMEELHARGTELASILPLEISKVRYPYPSSPLDT